MNIIFNIENHIVAKENNILKEYDVRYLSVMNYLMKTVKVNKLWSRNSCKEFISRFLIVTNTELTEYLENFKKSGSLINLKIDNYNFDLKLNDLKNFIGFCTNLNERFNYEGNKIQFIKYFNSIFSTELNLKFQINKKVEESDYLKEIDEIAELITSEISEDLFQSEKLNKKSNIDFLDFDKLFSFYAPSYLTKDDYLSVHKYLLNDKDFKRLKKEGYDDYKLDRKLNVTNEIINIAYGVKNKFVSNEDVLGKMNKTSNPFFEISHFILLDDFLNGSTIGSVLEKWNYKDWEKYIPYSSEILK